MTVFNLNITVEIKKINLLKSNKFSTRKRYSGLIFTMCAAHEALISSTLHYA